MRLTPRLQCIADMIRRGSSVADIGSDHAHLPIYLAENNICRRAVASDVHLGPLNSARSNIAAHGLEDVIQTNLGSGFENIGRYEVDTAVIAGMGGELIADILEAVPQGVNTLILQPMRNISVCRRAVHKNGFEIVRESLAEENGKIYNIIYAERAHKPPAAWSDFEYELSPLIERNELFFRYINARIKKLEKIIERLKNSDNAALAEKYGEEIKRLKSL